MTAAPAAAAKPGGDDLPARIFRALYQEFDLRMISDTYVVPKGTHGLPSPASAASPARSATTRGRLLPRPSCTDRRSSEQSPGICMHPARRARPERGWERLPTGRRRSARFGLPRHELRTDRSSRTTDRAQSPLPRVCRRHYPLALVH